MTKKFSMFVAISAIAAVPALAQTGQSGQGQSAKGTTPDMAFVKEAAVGGMAEVELGNLAKEKAASNDVKQFGDRMVTDHSKAGDELKAWAQQKNVTLPDKLDPRHQALRDRLARLSGAAFDRAYMREMVTDHQHDVAAFTRESKTEKDADVKAWAGKTLPTLQEHLKLAKDTASKAGVSGQAKAKGKPAF